MANKGQSPYSTRFASGQLDYELDPTTQMRIFKKEERDTHKAPNTLPFEMANLPEYFGNMVDNGFQACKTIQALLKTKDVENKKALLKLMKNTEKMIVYLLKNVDPTLEQYTIGAQHRGDKETDDDYEDLMYR